MLLRVDSDMNHTGINNNVCKKKADLRTSVDMNLIFVWKFLLIHAGMVYLVLFISHDVLWPAESGTFLTQFTSPDTI